jgi:flagellar basal body-associated protein FliL
MISQNLALYNWNNGVIMIAIFALVCVTLIGVLISFVMSGKKKEDDTQE